MGGNITYNKLFLKTKLEELSLAIKGDVDKLDEFEEVDFSHHYEDLKEISRYAIINKHILSTSEFKSAQYVLFAFAIEIAKKPSLSFWHEFYNELDIELYTKYNFILNRVCDILKDTGITIVRSDANRRLLVGTLRLMVKSDPALLNDATNFFIEYYKKYRTEGVENAFRAYEKYEE